jgi:hypothetical protein
MANSIPELTQVTAVPSNAFILLSYSGAPSQIVTFENFIKNFSFVQSSAGNDLLLGVGSSSSPVARISDTSKYFGISNSSAFSPLSLLHISGTTGSNALLTIENPTGVNGGIRLYDNTGSWYILKDNTNNFFISGTRTNDIYNNSLFINASGDVLITDGSQYVNTNVDTGINIQLFAANNIRLSVDNNSSSNDFTFNVDGINSTNDLYLGYSLPSNAINGSYFGLSGAVFVDKDDATVRIGDTNRATDARLMVSNSAAASAPYKTFLVEDAGVPNIFLRTTGSSNTASILYNQSISELHFALNKASASTASTDPIIFDLSNKQLGVGGISPDYPLDVIATTSLLYRFQTNQDSALTRIQSNYAGASGPVNYVATAYGSGDYNSFLIGYDFDKSASGPSGPSARQGQFFFQTGDSTNSYLSSRNIVTISDAGDIDAKGLYTSDSNYCYGKFLQIHRANCVSGSPIYLNFDNIDYEFQTSGSVAYHTLLPASGRIIGVDFLCQLNSGVNNATGYLVFTKYPNLQEVNVGGVNYISGSNNAGTAGFLPVWNPYTSSYQVPSFSNHVYVTGAITGQGILNLKARIGNTTVGNRFVGTTANLNFNRYQFGSWVAYAVSSAGAFVPLTGAMNLTTLAEYFYTSDTDSATGTYI